MEGKSSEDVARYFGYEGRPEGWVGIWKAEDFERRICQIPEVAGKICRSGKARIIIDFEADFPEVMIQVIRREEHSEIQERRMGFSEQVMKNVLFVLTMIAAVTGIARLFQ